MTGTDSNKLQFRGLVTNPNELAITGDGAMRQFVNGVLTRPALAQARRGIKHAATSTSAINKFINYDGSLLFHCGTGILKTLTAGTIGSLPGAVNVTPPVGRIRSCIAGKNLYVAGTTPWRVAGASGTPTAAGGLFPPGFVPEFTAFVNAGTAVVLADLNSMAYRYALGVTDDKGYDHVGEVSGRVVVTNSTGVTQDVRLRAAIPSAATTSHFIQFFRSAAAAGSTPDDDLQLIYERQLSTADIAAGYVELTDVTPESLRGAYIYTAPNGGEPTAEGRRPNRAPPGCVEVCSHVGRMWFGNTTQPAEFFLRLLAVGGTAGIQGGDTLRFAGLSSPFTLTGVRDFNATLSRAANVVTATTSEDHGYATNDWVMISTGDGTFGIGPKQITVTGLNTFTYAEVAADAVLADQAVVKVATSAGPANGTYTIRTAGTPSTNIDRTAQSMVAAFNQHTSNTELWMQTTAGPFDAPGEILVRGRTAATTSFVVFAGAGSQRDCFSPQLLPLAHTVSLTRTLGTTVTATVASGSQSFRVGEQVLISPGGAGSGGSTFGVGPFTVTSITSNTFVYAEAGTNGTLAAQTATVTPQDSADAECEQRPNRVYYSKVGEFEATTRSGWIDVGDGGGSIQAMFSQRGQIWVWKTDGIFRIIGTDPDTFDWEPMDAALHLRATESVALFSGRCWGLTDRGVVAVSETGVEVMSSAITDDLTRAWQTVTDNAAVLEAGGYGVISFELDCFATAYESDHAYILHIPSVYALDGNPALDGAGKYGGCPLAYVFNTQSGAWGLWDWGLNPIVGTVNAKRCAIVSALDDKLYLGDGYLGATQDAYLFVERKALLPTGASSDYRDTTSHHDTVGLSASGTTTVTATFSAGAVFTVGDAFYLPVGNANFPAGRYTILTVGATTFTYVQSIVRTATLANQLVILEKGIGITWAWVLQTADAPDREKRWDELKFIFGQRETYYPTARSNSQVAFDLALANESNSVAAFEVASQGGQISRVWPDAEVARGTRLLITLTHDTIDEAFDLAGIGIKAEVLDGASTQ